MAWKAALHSREPIETLTFQLHFSNCVAFSAVILTKPNDRKIPSRTILNLSYGQLVTFHLKGGKRIDCQKFHLLSSRSSS